MAQTEDFLSAILQDPKSMQMVSSLLSGLGGTDSKEQSPAAPSLTDALSSLDIEKIGSLIQKINGPPDERCKLLLALRPFVSGERKARIDQSVQILKLLNLSEVMGGISHV